MAKYIKANPLVARHLGLTHMRNTVPDGNYLLWQNDMLPFGPLWDLDATLERIGAIALLPHEARQEQDGIILRPLPTATDPAFIIPAADAGTEATEGDPIEEEEEEEATEGDPIEEEGEEEEATEGDPIEEEEEATEGDPIEEEEEATEGDPIEEEEEEEATEGDPIEEEEEEATEGDPIEEEEEEETTTGKEEVHP